MVNAINGLSPNATGAPKPVQHEAEICHEAASFLSLAAELLAKNGWSHPGAQGFESGPRSIENALATMVNSTDLLMGENQDHTAAFEQAIDALWLVASASGSRSLEAWQRTPGRGSREVQRLLERAIDTLTTGKAPGVPNSVIAEVLGQAAYLLQREGHCKGRAERMHPNGEGKERSAMTAVFDAAVQVARSDSDRAPTGSLPLELYTAALGQLDRALPWHWRGQIKGWSDDRDSNAQSVHRVLAGAAESCGQPYVWSNEKERCWASFPTDRDVAILFARELSSGAWTWSVVRTADGHTLSGGKENSLHSARARAEHAHANLNPIGGPR